MTKNQLLNSIVKIPQFTYRKVASFTRVTNQESTFPEKVTLNRHQISLSKNLKRVSNQGVLILVTVVQIKKRRGQAVSSLFRFQHKSKQWSLVVGF